MAVLLDAFKNTDMARYWLIPSFSHIKHWLSALGSERSNFHKVESIHNLAMEKGWNYHLCQPARIQIRLPSKTIPDDSLLILKMGNTFARKHTNSKYLHDSQRGEMYFSQLSCLVRYLIPETFVCEIPNVYIHCPSGWIVSSDYELLLQSCNRRLANLVPPMKRVPKKAEELNGSFVSLMGWSSHNYSHWLMDILPRLSVLNGNNIDLQFLVSEPVLPFQNQSIRLWGINDKAIVSLAPGWYKLERILFCYAAERSSITSEFHMQDMSKRFRQACEIRDEQIIPFRHIYISRANSRRKLLNEDEILKVIQDYKFEVVRCEELSFKEQVQLFSEAKIILGDHGSGVNNQIFSRQGTKVIEMYNPAMFHHCICITSSVMGHEHWHTFSENIDHNWNCRMNPGKLRKLLGYVLNDSTAIESVF